jgi:hypothetical protein
LLYTIKYQIKLFDFKRKNKKIITGLTVPQEYVCVELEGFQKPLSVILASENQNTLPMSHPHICF